MKDRAVTERLRRGLDYAEIENTKAELRQIEAQMSEIAKRVQRAYGRGYGAKARVLLRHVIGLRHDINDRFAEQIEGEGP